MTEYIEREALRASVESIDWYSVFRGELTTGAKSSENALYKANDIYLAIDNAPTADVAPVRHGRWIYIGKYGEYECSVCHGIDTDCSDYYGSHVVTEQEYCPNCGAKMDKEDSQCDT